MKAGDTITATISAQNTTAKGWLPESITYCSNVHAGESLDEVLLNLHHFNRQVRQRRTLDTMTSGLWLSAAAADTLQQPGPLESFKHTLCATSLTLTSINGFPFGNFHDAQVKEKVYLPDWSDTARLNYTKNLANILANCLPKDITQGAISTLPLGYRSFWNTQKQTAANNNIQAMLQHLAELYQTTGKQILLCIEMEPDCVLESTEELLRYFKQEVQTVMRHSEYLGICFDVCHQAVMFEDIKQSLENITNAGIRIGKIQLSSALQADLNTPEKKKTLHYLHKFSEPRYLHQVKTISHDQHRKSSPDLTQALSDTAHTRLPSDKPWRIHFHVPLHTATLLHPSLCTTRQALHDVFDFLKQYSHIRPCLEVETYSWQALPESLRPKNDDQLIDGIVSELQWVEDELRQRELLTTVENDDA